MENLKRFKTRFLLTMLMVFAGGNLFAATQTATIAVSDQIVASGGYTDSGSGITVQVVGSGSEPSFAGSELTLPRGRQLLITSSHAMTGVTFSSYTSVDAGTGNAGAFTGNTFNGTFSATGTTGTWASRSAFSNVGTIVLSVTGDEAADAVKLSGNIEITYDDAESTTKTKPSITVTPTAYTGNNAVLPNFDKLAEPAVVLKVGDTNVTPYYQVNYYIDGQPTDGLATNSRGAEITKDPVTGSEVERVYGQFLAGSKAGTVKVMIVAVPRNAYASQYEIVEGSYEVEIKKIKPQIGFEYNIPENGITLNVNQTIAQTQYSNTWQYQNSYEEHVALPKYTLDYVLPSGAKESALKYFDVTIEHLNTDRTPITVEDTDGKTYAVKMDRITPTTENKLTQDSITVSSTASTALVTGLSESDARSQAVASVVQGTNYVKYTFAPKAGYGDTYETPDPVEISVTVGVIEGKIKLKLEGISDNAEKPDTIRLYKYNQDGLASKHPDALPIPTLKDQNNKELIVTGNPITYNYVIVKDSVYYDDCTNDTIKAAVYEGTQSTGKLTGLQLQYTPGGTHLIQTGNAGLTKVIVFASVASWYTGYDNVFKMYDDQYPDMKDGYGNPISKIITEPRVFYVESLKREPYVVIRDQEGHELNEIDVYKGQEITFNNMFNIAGRFDDEHNKATELGSAPEELEFASASNPNGFWYTFNVRASLLQPTDPSDPTTAPMQILNWPSASQIDVVKDQAGNDSIYLYHSDRGYGDAYRSWQIRFNTDGEYPIGYTIHAWNHVKWDTSSSATKTIEFVVTNKKTTVLVIDPKEKFAKTTDGSNFDEPSVKVMCGNEDVTEKFDITYAIKDGTDITDGTEGATGTQIITATGVVTIGTHTGIEVVNVTATAKTSPTDYSVEYVNPSSDTYRIKITDDDMGYEIMNKCADEDALTSNPDLLGKFHILSGTKLASGTTITGVPGMDITFGNFEETVDWYIQGTGITHSDCSHASEVFVINGGQVELDEEQLPTHGGYITFSPYTNGYLTVDARWQAGATYRLICKTADGTIWTEDYKPTAEVNGEHTFTDALIAGNEYYLYDMTNGDFNLHGANFTPSYVVNRNTVNGTIAAGTIFMNGYQGGIPTLFKEPSNYVTFESQSPDYATVDSNGVLTPVKNTYDYTGTGNPTGFEKYVAITATVSSSKTGTGTGLCETLQKTAKLYVFISDIPTYWTPDVADEDKVQPTAGTVVTTTNIATNIKMTFGGWKSGTTTHGTQSKDDAWTFKGKANRVGGGEDDNDATYNQYLDGFDCYTSGDNNPKDEKGVQYTTYNYNRGSQYDYVVNSKGAFTAPVTGTYLKFEPRESGTLFVYVVQNGACDKHNNNKAADNYKMKWRPFYITDEKGEPVTMNHDFTKVDDYLAPQDQVDNLGAYTRGIIRSTVNDATVAAVVGANKHPIENMKETENCVYDWSEFKGTANDADNLIKEWKGKAVGARQDLIRLDNGGYTLVHKAYVRYTFNVKAGKTYFVLQGGSKLEFGGFSFLPAGFPTAGSYNQADGKTQADLPVQTYDNFTTEVSDCDYTVKNHTFTAGKWTSICLPFSVQESQVKEIFGDDVMLLTCDSVMTKTPGKTNYLHFTQHAYRMIEAGRPYLIKPSEMSSTLYDNGSTTFKHVSIEMTDGHAVNPSIYDVSLLGGNYIFKGLYEGEEMPAYSYFAAADGLYRYDASYGDKDNMSYRAYFKTTLGTAARSIGFNMLLEDALDRIVPEEGVTTGILSISDNGDIDVNLSDDRIFNMQGVCVGRGADQLQSLPQGIYIIGGRKHVVK